MPKRFAHLKDRFLSRFKRPFRYNRANKDKDLNEPIVTIGENNITPSKNISSKQKKVTCSWLRAEHARKNKKSSRNPNTSQGGCFTEESEVECNKHREDELEDAKQSPKSTRRQSSAFLRLKNWVKTENRRDAICEQMEREIETRGVSLRQYRKFLATTYILYDLKML